MSYCHGNLKSAIPPETWVNLEKMERKMSFEVLPEKFFFPTTHYFNVNEIQAIFLLM